MVRNDTYNSFIEMGNATNLVDTYIDFEGPTYTDYGLRIHRDMALSSYIIHRGTAAFNISANESAIIHIKTSNTD